MADGRPRHIDERRPMPDGTVSKHGIEPDEEILHERRVGTVQIRVRETALMVEVTTVTDQHDDGEW